MVYAPLGLYLFVLSGVGAVSDDRVLALLTGPNWVCSTWRQRQNSVSEICVLNKNRMMDMSRNSESDDRKCRIPVSHGADMKRVGFLAAISSGSETDWRSRLHLESLVAEFPAHAGFSFPSLSENRGGDFQRRPGFPPKLRIAFEVRDLTTNKTLFEKVAEVQNSIGRSEMLVQFQCFLKSYLYHVTNKAHWVSTQQSTYFSKLISLMKRHRKFNADERNWISST
jgi:hypothetical protein